jgi:hypothetical protein
MIGDQLPPPLPAPTDTDLTEWTTRQLVRLAMLVFLLGMVAGGLATVIVAAVLR